MIIEETKKIIESLSMNEKRYFKLFVNKNIFGNQNKYLMLFDIFNNFTDIDEQLLKKHINEHQFSDKNVSYDLNYLNKLILRSLNEFHYEKTVSLKLQNLIKSVEILFYKGLYEECLRIIQKAKKLNSKNENEILMLELLNWEKKCMGYSKGFQGAMSVNKKIDEYFNSIKRNRTIVDLYYHSYYLKNSTGKIALEKIISEFEQIIQHPLIVDHKELLTSTQPRIFKELIFANYFHVLQQTANELKHLEKAIEIYDEQVFYKQENPLDYISVYTRIIDIYKKSDDATFYNKIEGLRQFDSILDFQKNVALERIFFHTYLAELEHLVYNNQFQEGLQMMQHIVKQINTNKFNIEPYYYIGMYYQFACITLITKNLSQSLKHINYILNEFDFNDRPNTFIKAEILNIIIHFELKNYKLVLHNLNSFKKKYTKTFKINALEKKILKLIEAISNDPYLKKTSIEFANLHKKIVQMEIEKTNSNLIYLNYILSKK
ncbi:Protein of unknown function [Flavobacterium indicum GPTSA100-9 = DSM 17447]|uniref:Uncharacterized protein n=1 Tax=Flavobacterium indicum (strain DSM 17447 / CIP 109464 / GPTSA100-9) TaxID=1094466 RepID=H8XVF3_FLAIG|nr:hypothetical protein [Flavobacterium indicum]CCG53123.1 Protein of unknown function [Flavobacterium indicum GPTSA100-9 = DSM 17447]